MREAGGRIVLMDFGAGEVRARQAIHCGARLAPLYLAPEFWAASLRRRSAISTASASCSTTF